MHDASDATPVTAPHKTGALRDVLAGLSAATVVVPKAMAYATIASLPVAVGLYTACIPVVVYALLGTSQVLSVSSTTTLAVLSGAALGQTAASGNAPLLLTSAATLTVLVGVVLVFAALLRLGFLASFMSVPVLTGFKAGIGFVILLDQVPKLLGLHYAKAGFFPDLASLAGHLPELSWLTLVVASASVIVLLATERWVPRAPAPLVAVGGGILASWALGLSEHHVSIVGAIPQGIPSLSLPSFELVAALLPSALGIALMSFTESIAAGRAFRVPSDPPIESNRELLATGAANIAGAFLGSMPAGGGTSQTSVVRQAGGASRAAGFATALVALATMLLLAPLLGLLPQATLAAIVIVYSMSLIQPKEFVAIRRVRMLEFRWALAAFAGVLLFGTLQGILIAILVSMISLISQTTNPRVSVIARKRGADVLRPLSEEHPDDELFGGLLIIRPEGSIYFANAENIREQVQALVAQHHPEVVAMDMSRVPDLEYSGLHLIHEAENRQVKGGPTWWLVGLNPRVLQAVRRSGLADRFGRERMLFNARAAIARYQELKAGETRA
ncbi:MAG: SulP family inorganic anion transporter [Planctomycetes bacterium]|nr:SulP family inorganic anion transporter [Planctomycetota bacterium]